MAFGELWQTKKPGGGGDEHEVVWTILKMRGFANHRIRAAERRGGVKGDGVQGKEQDLPTHLGGFKDSRPVWVSQK